MRVGFVSRITLPRSVYVVAESGHSDAIEWVFALS